MWGVRWDQIRGDVNVMMWVCCQLGAREHYAVAAALHHQYQLAALITDAWVPSSSRLHGWPFFGLSRLRDRTHLGLISAPVYAWTGAALRFEVSQTIRGVNGWQRILHRNQWFQQQTIKTLMSLQPALAQLPSTPVLFAYSYAALEIFRYAKQQGWTTVLGQIDPGWLEEAKVHQEFIDHGATYADLGVDVQRAPSAYWDNWREECRLADYIVVNSNWSAQALQQVGVAAKVQVMPLAYAPAGGAAAFQRTYPSQFSGDRPLRVLFLGQFIVRKGISALLQAAAQLVNQPIEFWIVGSPPLQSAKFAALPNLRWFGSVPRHAVDPLYQTADVFLFPTLSDGFGLTQLEAQAWQLPIIASRFCGEVVKDQVNGVILSAVTAEAIAAVLQNWINHPELLLALSRQSVDLSDFSLLRLQERLQGMVGGDPLPGSLGRT